ncbi:carbohydrate kinase family protein [Anaerolentibacter hominis]|uniref:carbohydrate kinase family protein n=1 Tax=Anaerolentibacter hominis TaxID=3079009 RepID=UPI0031B896C5
MKKLVVSAGQICLDVTPIASPLAGDDFKKHIEPGHMVPMLGMDMCIGGSVGNTGLGLAKLGQDAFDVRVIAKLGDDITGRIVQDILKGHPVIDGTVVEENTATAYTLTLTPAGVDKRTFFHCPGASARFSAADIDFEGIRDAVLFHFGYPGTMDRMYPNDGEELVRMMERAHALGMATSLDMSPIEETSNAARCDWNYILKRTLPFVDFFVPSIEEMLLMFKPERRDELRRRAAEENRDITELVSLEEDVEPLARQAIEYGAAIVLLKCGVPGVYFCTAGEERLKKIGKNLGLDAGKWADLGWFEKSFVPERIASATGCGDTTIAAFLTGVIEGMLPEKCMQYALATGACCVASYDTLGGLLPLDQLEKKIQAGWPRVTVEIS